MRGMTEFKEGRGPRPQLADATGTERRIHTYLVTEEEPKTVDQIVKALAIEDDPVPEPPEQVEGQPPPPPPPEPRTAVRKVQDAIADLSRAALVRGDAAGGYTGVSP